MPRPGVGVFGRNAAPVLEIKPESPFVVFYGESSESHETELKGKLILQNPESIHVRSIRITLTGSRKVSWHLTNTVSPQPITQKTTFLVDTLNLFPVDAGTPKAKAHKINAGYHEWDFSFKMPRDLDQSVEGLPTNWVVYNLKASVDRGYMSKQLSATSHIRVIRTLGRDLLESVPMEQINEDIWANKLAYKITVPQKNYIIGTHITADFVLIPLRKGVEISTIKMELIESRQLFADYAGRRISHQTDIQVASTEGDLPENSARLVPNGVEDADELFDESHRFSMKLDLPTSLKHCRQSVDTENIRLTHKLRLYVNLKNPEGHTSQLLVKNHVHLFISPYLPPNEDQSVVVDQNVLNQQAIQDEVNQNAPPTYGLHQLDELYNDIDPSGFMTPGGTHSMMNSGANTPFYAHSRSGSAEDLASLDAVAHTQPGGGASAAALQYRLQNLDMSAERPSRFQTRQNGSGDSTPAEPSYFDLETASYDMNALVRTPSYNTAVRTPVSRTPGGIIDSELPTYEIAMSRPGSPSRSRGSRGTTPSPARSLDTLNEETYRNTQINSQRQSPRGQSPRMSDDGSSGQSPYTRPGSTTRSRSTSSLLVPVLTNSSSSSADSLDIQAPCTPPQLRARPRPTSGSMYLSPDSALRPRHGQGRRGRSASSSTSNLLDVPGTESRFLSREEEKKNRLRSPSTASVGSDASGVSIRDAVQGLRGFRRALRFVE